MPVTADAEKLAKKFLEVRNHSEKLCAPLNPEDYVPQPVEYVSPAKWHLAHTSWFFEDFILNHYYPGYKEFHPDFSYLFNSYYIGKGERVDRGLRGLMSRPGVERVYEYRRHVDKHMNELLQDPQKAEEIAELVVLGMQHEQQHQELILTDIKFVFGHNPLFPPFDRDGSLERFTPQSGPDVEIDEGVYEIGKERGDNSFGYDNEYERHKVYLNACQIEGNLVANGEYLKFIEDGGYQNHRWWHSDAWAWIQEEDIRHPLHWHEKEGKYYRYAMHGLEPVDPNMPVTHVSFYEASAFAMWKGKRLPTEAEWEVAAPQLNWGDAWEWTSSAYSPYPGYRRPEGAVGEYNGKFMVNQYVLRGASRFTSPGHSRITYRNFFHSHLQWQFTGIRLCQDI